MNNCQYCGASNPATVFNCLKCAAVMSVAPAPAQNISVIQQRPLRPSAAPAVAQAEKHPATQMSFKELGIYFASAFAVVAVVWAVLYFMSIAAPQSSASMISTPAPVVETATIKASGGILLATTEETFDEMMRAAANDDAAYLVRMGTDGKLFRLQDKTKIRIVEPGLFKSKVVALEGNQTGRGGWLSNEFISK